MKTVSVREFASQTGIKEGQIRDLTFVKTFPCLRIGRRVHIYEEQAHRWLESRLGKSIKI